MGERKSYEPKSFHLEDAEILSKSKNFKGTANERNENGTPQFTIVIRDPEFGESLMRDGWNIRRYGDDDNRKYYMTINVYLHGNERYVSTVEMYDESDGSTSVLGDEDLGILDDSFITVADILVQQKWYKRAFREGYSNVLRLGKFTVRKAIRPDYSKTDADNDLPF